MPIVKILPNVIAMVSASIAMILLSIFAAKIGGSIGKTIKLIIIGIFFSVFLHAGFELAEIYNIIIEAILMPIMGVLLSLGSVIFIVSGFMGLKALKD